MPFGDWQTRLYGNMQWKDSSKLLLFGSTKNNNSKVLERDEGDFFSLTIHLHLGILYVFEMLI